MDHPHSVSGSPVDLLRAGLIPFNCSLLLLPLLGVSVFCLWNMKDLNLHNLEKIIQPF